VLDEGGTPLRLFLGFDFFSAVRENGRHENVRQRVGGLPIGCSLRPEQSTWKKG